MKTLNESKSTLVKRQLKNAAAYLMTNIVGICIPILVSASVESSLQAVHSKLVGTLLPLFAICGLIFAGFSFVMGHANARQHLIYAIIGAGVGFGAESIVALVRGVIQ